MRSVLGAGEAPVLYLLGSVVPYAAVAVFVIGTAWRTWSWLRRPVPFPLALSPVGERPARRAAALARHVFLFEDLYRGERRLWLAAWLLHASLLAIIAGHVAGIALLGRQFTYAGASPETSEAISRMSGLFCGGLFVACIAALCYRRIAVPEVRKLSQPADYFDLALLLSIAASGMQMRMAASHMDLAAVRGYLASLLVLRPVGMPAQWGFVVHFALVNVLLIYFPFSKLAHLTGSFVSRALVGPVRRAARAGAGAGQGMRVVRERL